MRFLGLLIGFFIVARPVLPVIDYVFNYDYIVTQLCINRERPELHCNGKCYLMTAMAREARQEQRQKKENLASRYAPALLYYEDHRLLWEALEPTQRLEQTTDCYLNRYKFLFREKQLRPPIS